MGARQRKWAAAAREVLIFKLGRACRKCGGMRDLQFDCIEPKGHDHHRRYDPSWRISFYRAEHARGNLQLLCQDCHSEKTQADLAAENPF